MPINTLSDNSVLYFFLIEVALQKRNSYGIRWNATDKTLSVYLQRVTNCHDKCLYDIKFTSKGDKDDQALNKVSDFVINAKWQSMLCNSTL